MIRSKGSPDSDSLSGRDRLSHDRVLALRPRKGRGSFQNTATVGRTSLAARRHEIALKKKQPLKRSGLHFLSVDLADHFKNVI